MNAEIKAKWCEALRSGKYKQGTGRLRSGDGYCCLGVLCDLSGLGGWVKDGEGEWDFSCGESFYLTHHPREVADWAGLEQYGTQSSRLVGMNDGEIPFPVIADHIEKNL